MSGVLLLTLSRGALLALAFALIIFTAIRWRWGWIILIVAALGVGIVLYRVDSYTLLEALLSGTSVGSLEGRFEILSRAILLAREFPFTGVGMGLATEVINQLFPFSQFDIHLMSHTHNLYVQVFLDIGIVGFIGWMATLMLAIYMAWKVYRTGIRTYRAGWIAGIGAGLFCGQIALALHGFTDAVTWGMIRPAPLVWALWGLIMSTGNLTLRQNLSDGD